MNEDGGKSLTREERLAVKLRENLRRRKAQARKIGGSPEAFLQQGGESGLPKGETTG